MADNVRVAVRVRPFNGREKERSSKLIIRMDGNSTWIQNREDGTEKMFSFDFSYNSFVERSDPAYATQTSVYNDLGIGILNNAYEGYNCSLFAYGQTGSGKSYSMVGYGEDRGIIPIICENIFQRMGASTGDADLTIKVTCSMLEIYMEKIKDLFNPSAGELKIRNDPKKGFFVESLTQNAVANYESISKLMDSGSKARTVASTAMNATSSRAHTIFQIILTQTKTDRATMSAKDKVAIINLIDLAGSERADSTGATGDRLKEGAAINLSLTCLGNCISALAANSDPANKKKGRVPYRDSALTMLLQNSLGGNAKTIMIAALSPADINYDETLSTLRYADRAKQIKNKAVVNEDPNEKLIRGLHEEIEALRRALAGGGALPGGGAGAAAGGAGASEADRARIRAELESERGAEMSRLREELEAKIKQELEESKTWEQRLAETSLRQEARERELREMGVLSGAERAAQLERAASVPHMSNLNEDPQMAGQIIFFFEPGSAVSVGRKDAATPKDVKLGGIALLADHALIRHAPPAADGAPGEISVEPATPGAKIDVNGDAIAGPTRLGHLSRLVFGATHAYVVRVPGEAASWTPDTPDLPPPNEIDYSYAIMEINKSQTKAFSEGEAKRRQESEAERKRSEQLVAELEARMRTERAAAELEAAEKLRAMEEKAKASEGNEELVRKLREEQSAHEAASKRRTEELEQKLREQIAETERVSKKKEKDIRERSLLDEKLLKTIPLVNEANAISEELGKGMAFEPKLMANQHKAPLLALGDEGGDGGGASAAAEQMETLVYIRVSPSAAAIAASPTAAALPPVFWHYEKFSNRLYIMREMYEAWSERGRSLAGTEFADPERDPFFDPPEDTLIGKSTMFLDSLAHCLSVDDALPIIDYKGAEQGELLVRILPHAGEAPPKSAAGGGSGGAAGVGGEDEDDGGFDVERLDELKGKKVGITICIDGARGLPATFAGAGTYVKYRFYLEEAAETARSAKKSINPRFEFLRTLRPVVTDELVRYVKSEALDFEVWGVPIAATARKASIVGAASSAASAGSAAPPPRAGAASLQPAAAAPVAPAPAPAAPPPATPAASLPPAAAPSSQPAGAAATPSPPPAAVQSPPLAPDTAASASTPAPSPPAAAAAVPASPDAPKKSKFCVLL